MFFTFIHFLAAIEKMHADYQALEKILE